jgi:hypothetical protein
MTTGRINQVAFLSDAPHRVIPPTGKAGRAKTGEDVVRDRRLAPSFGQTGEKPRTDILFRIRETERDARDPWQRRRKWRGMRGSRGPPRGPPRAPHGDAGRKEPTRGTIAFSI